MLASKISGNVVGVLEQLIYVPTKTIHDSRCLEIGRVDCLPRTPGTTREWTLVEHHAKLCLERRQSMLSRPICIFSWINCMVIQFHSCCFFCEIRTTVDGGVEVHP
eukprot:COSAG02_NODE_206_length_29144_cov_12.855121_29_plen_106_part_00